MELFDTSKTLNTTCWDCKVEDGGVGAITFEDVLRVGAMSSRCKTFLPSFSWVILGGGGGERVGHTVGGVDVVDVASVFVFHLSSRPIGLVSSQDFSSICCDGTTERV